jgi:hypothetical protein
MNALPSRPSLGRRERWLAVAVLFVMSEGLAIRLGITVPAEHVSIALGAIIAFVGGETWRPSGTSRPTAGE